MISRPRAIIAFALMFWCAGTACMMVSYAHAANARADVPQVNQTSFNPGPAHACCQARLKSRKRVATSTAHAQSQSADVDARLFTLPAPTQSGSMSCCPLTTGSIVAGSRTQINDEAPLLKQSGSSFESESSTPARLVVPLRLPNQAKSYLLDCVFLI